MTQPEPVPKPSIDVRVFSATVGALKGAAVAWGHPRRKFRQTVFFSTRAHAEQFAAGLRAGQEPQRLLLMIWGIGQPVSHADMGRKGGPARAAALSPERRREIARQAIGARWDRVRAEAAKLAAETTGLPEGGSNGG